MGLALPTADRSARGTLEAANPPVAAPHYSEAATVYLILKFTAVQLSAQRSLAARENAREDGCQCRSNKEMLLPLYMTGGISLP